MLLSAFADDCSLREVCTDNALVAIGMEACQSASVSRFSPPTRAILFVGDEASGREVQHWVCEAHGHEQYRQCEISAARHPRHGMLRTHRAAHLTPPLARAMSVSVRSQVSGAPLGLARTDSDLRFHCCWPSLSY